MDSRKIVMTFIDSANSKYNVTISDVKKDVTKDEIAAVMDYVVKNNIMISNKGMLTESYSASIVDTTETEYKIA